MFYQATMRQRARLHCRLISLKDPDDYPRKTGLKLNNKSEIFNEILYVNDAARKTLFAFILQISSGCAFGLGAISPSARAAIPNTLVFCAHGAPEGFEPGLYTGTYTHSAASATVYNRLVDFERGATKLVPSLAERWEISKDGRQYTFYLRRGVKFHATPWFQPTREFNAEDVLFTFNRMRDPAMPFRRAIPLTFLIGTIPDSTGLSRKSRRWARTGGRSGLR